MRTPVGRDFPKIAGRLALDRDAKEVCPDPYVERLLEGFAFLAARVHLLPALGYQGFSYVILPALVLAVEIAPFVIRTLTTSLGEVMQAPFIDEARVRGQAGRLPRRHGGLGRRSSAGRETDREEDRRHDPSTTHAAIPRREIMATREVGNTIDSTGCAGSGAGDSP